MTKVPARPAAAVPPRPAAAPQPGKAAIPAAAAKPVVAPSNPATNPVAGINKEGEVAVNQPASTVAHSIAANTSAGTTEGQSTEVSSELAGGAEVVAAPKRRGRKPGAGGGKGAPRKATYPGLLSVDESGAPVMVDDGKGGQSQQRNILQTIPEDFDPAKHEKLRPSDFTDEGLYCEHMAASLTALAAKWTKKAKKIRALGSATDQKKALKFLKMREQMEALRKQLQAEGMDIDSLDSEDEGSEATE